MNYRRLSAILASILSVGLADAAADEVSFGRSILFIDHDGPNTFGLTPGVNITTAIENVEPQIGTIVTATQGSTVIPVNSLFLSTGFSNSLHFGTEVGIDTGLTGPWQITTSNILGVPDTKHSVTNSVAGVAVLPLPTGLAVNSPVDTGALSPTVSWVNPAGDFTVTFLEIWDDTHDILITRRGCSGSLTCESISIPIGILAPGADYSFRTIVEDRSNPSDFLTVSTRSNASVNFTTTSTAREAGSVDTVQAGVGDNGSVIVAGANNLPDLSINVGTPSGRGAIRLGAGDSLTTSYLAAGRTTGTFGNIVIDGGTLTLNGTDVFSGDPNGGFLHVGRDGTGYVFISDGATVTMNADGHPFPGFQVGRNAGSFGHMVVDGAGTTVTIDGSTVVSSNPNEIGFIAVGRAGVGRLDITNGATVANDPNGGTLIGVSRDGIGGRGSVSVDGPGSVLDGGAVIELGDPNGFGGLGRLAVSNGGKVLADVINVHTGGILTGDLGSIGDALNNVLVNVMGGVVAPGFSPGTMTIHGDLVLSSGDLLLEAFSDTLFDQIIVEGDLILDGGSIQVVLGYTPTSSLDFFQVMGTTSIGAGFGGIDVFAPLGSGVEEGTSVTVDIDGTTFTELAVLQQAPAPATLALLAPALALGGLTLRRRRRYGRIGASNGTVQAS